MPVGPREMPGVVVVGPGGAGDVGVNPGSVAGELLEEHGGGGGSARSGWLQVLRMSAIWDLIWSR